MKIVPDIVTLRYLLERSVEENKLLLGEILPLYEESAALLGAERKREYEERVEAKRIYSKEIDKYAKELHKWQNGWKLFRGAPPKAPTPYARAYDPYESLMYPFYPAFQSIKNSCQKALKESEELLYSLSYTSNILEMTGEDVERISRIVNFGKLRNEFEAEKSCLQKEIYENTK